jgi:hypothetical protein
MPLLWQSSHGAREGWPAHEGSPHAVPTLWVQSYGLAPLRGSSRECRRKTPLPTMRPLARTALSARAREAARSRSIVPLQGADDRGSALYRHSTWRTVRSLLRLSPLAEEGSGSRDPLGLQHQALGVLARVCGGRSPPANAGGKRKPGQPSSGLDHQGHATSEHSPGPRSAEKASRMNTRRTGHSRRRASFRRRRSARRESASPRGPTTALTPTPRGIPTAPTA